MNYEEYKSLQEETLITSNDLENKEDRTLLYGYTTDRKTFEVYLLSGDIITEIEGEKVSVSRNADYIPNKRVYPDKSDFEFCKLLTEKGYSIPFLPLFRTQTKGGRNNQKKRLKVGDHVSIKNKDGIVDDNDPNCEGCIVGIEGDYVYITNLNMPFIGSLLREKISMERIVK